MHASRLFVAAFRKDAGLNKKAVDALRRIVTTIQDFRERAPPVMIQSLLWPEFTQKAMLSATEAQGLLADQNQLKAAKLRNPECQNDALFSRRGFTRGKQAKQMTKI